MSFEVAIPEYPDETKVSLLEDGTIVFVKIEHDFDAGNPLTKSEGMGIIYSFSRQHANFIDSDKIEEILSSEADSVPLSYYEHGQSMWFVMSSPTPAGAGVEFQWDGRRFAGLWVPDKSVKESYMSQNGLSRKEWMAKQAESSCEVYTKWCNGETYGFTIEQYKVRLDEDGEPFDQEDDYRRDKAIFEDSCWSFYGLEDVISSIKESLPDAFVVKV